MNCAFQRINAFAPFRPYTDAMLLIMRKLSLLCALGFAFTPAMAQTQADNDTAVLEQAAAYLNNIDTLQARFLQIDGRGGVAEGDLFIDRPGKMRLAYDPPTPVLIVADGYYVIYVDLELGEPSYLDIDDTPAAFLLDPEWSFTDDTVEVKSIVRQPGVVEITATQTRDVSAGELTFVFSERPFELRQWRVKDAQSQEITVTLFETRTGISLAPALFKFEDEDVFEDD